jgi:DNA-binding winged helix-turn-helix (wHTH) protein/TolB-like protein/Tfp pilus assembly protein PilF
MENLLRFATFTLDTAGGLVKEGDRLLVLRRQPFKVLAYLAERPARLVTNRELIESCWENPRQTSVNSLAQCIKAIREALGETDQEIIRTVHGQGYVFTAQVSNQGSNQVSNQASTEIAASPAADLVSTLPALAEESASSAGAVSSEPVPSPKRDWLRGARGPWRVAAAAIVLVAVLLAGAWGIRGWLRGAAPTIMAVPSIAVLSFATVGDENHKGDAVALSDDIVTDLARVPRGYNLRIESAAGYKLAGIPLRSIGRQLGVRYLVAGSVRREGEVRQINVQLIEAEQNRTVWAELFSYSLGQAEARNRMAESIARALGAQVLRAESRLPLPDHPVAGDFVILGRALMSEQGGRQGNLQSRAFFDKARALDPDLVPALLGYGRTRVNMVLNGWVPADQEGQLHDEAESAIRRATEIDSRDVGLQVLRGADLRARGRDDDAIAAFQRAIELLPSYAVAHAELGRAKIEVGMASDAVADLEEAIRLSPNDPYIGTWYFWAGMAEAHAGHYKQAIKWLLSARNENRVHVNAAPWLAVAHGGLEEWDEARLYLKQHLEQVPKFSLARWNRSFPSRHPAVEAQRARIVAILCHLGTPGCAVTTNIAR